VRKTYVRYTSHEVRTPLNAVKMGLQLLQAELKDALGPAYADLLQSLDITQAACNEAVHILDEMLAFDKIEGGNLKLDLQEVSARDLVVSAVSLFQAQVGWLTALSRASHRVRVTLVSPVSHDIFLVSVAIRLTRGIFTGSTERSYSYL